MARTTKRTPNRQRQILRALELGASRRVAAEANGVATSTFYDWMKNADFADAVETAEARLAVALLEQLQEAIAKGDAASARWLLERRFPDEFGKRVDLRMHYSTEQGEGLVEIIRRIILELEPQRQQDVLAWMEALENGLALPEEGDLLALPEEVEAA